MESECYCTTLRTATRRITAFYDDALEPVGVNVAQWSLLRILTRAPRRPVSIQELADRAELERSTTARNVRVLERLGLVQVGSVDGDRRVAAVDLTERGRSVLQRGEPLWREAQARFEEKLGAREAIDLRSLLGAL